MTSIHVLCSIHGIRSGRALKEFRGHGAFVSRARYTADNDQVVSCSADGTVRIWDARACSCSAAFRPPAAQGAPETPIVDLLLDPRDPSRVFVVPRGPTAYIVNLAGEVLRTLSSGREGSFAAAAVSARGAYLYCLADDGYVTAFATDVGKVECSFQVTDKEPVGIAHHPLRNLLATYADDAELRLWKPE